MVSPWRSQEQRKRGTIGGNGWCRTFSDLLAGDCTPILATSIGPIKKGHWNWELFIGFSGYEFLGNYGFLTRTHADVKSAPQ